MDPCCNPPGVRPPCSNVPGVRGPNTPGVRGGPRELNIPEKQQVLGLV